MGAMTAEAIKEIDSNLENQIGFHLRVNIYPPAPYDLVPACIAAIDAVNTNSDWYEFITLPAGIMYRRKFQSVPAWAIIRTFRLDTWIIESELDNE